MQQAVVRLSQVQGKSPGYRQIKANMKGPRNDSNKDLQGVYGNDTVQRCQAIQTPNE